MLSNRWCNIDEHFSGLKDQKKSEKFCHKELTSFPSESAFHYSARRKIKVLLLVSLYLGSVLYLNFRLLSLKGHGLKTSFDLEIFRLGRRSAFLSEISFFELNRRSESFEHCRKLLEIVGYRRKLSDIVGQVFFPIPRNFSYWHYWKTNFFCQVANIFEWTKTYVLRIQHTRKEKKWIKWRKIVGKIINSS